MLLVFVGATVCIITISPYVTTRSSINIGLLQLEWLDELVRNAQLFSSFSLATRFQYRKDLFLFVSIQRDEVHLHTQRLLTNFFEVSGLPA